MAVKTTVTSIGGLADHFRQMSARVEVATANPPQQQIACPRCGATSFQYDDEKGDAGHMICNGCGDDLGTHGEVMERAVREMAFKVIRG